MEKVQRERSQAMIKALGLIFQMVAFAAMFPLGMIWISLMGNTLVEDFGKNGLDMFFFYVGLGHYILGTLGFLWLTFHIRNI